MTEDGQRRGAVSEGFAARLLQEITDGLHPAWWTGWRWATEDEDQIHAIDLCVLTDLGAIPVQVKSSGHGVRKHWKRHAEWKGAVFVVWSNELSGGAKSRERAKRRLFALVRACYHEAQAVARSGRGE